ncbi:MAG: hypothetical protein SF339_23180 [Blastocatellia bacterium]|nr:hypothetical protein [Blastocatellia bacterium]
MKKIPPRHSVPIWIQIATLVLTVALIAFFIAAYFQTPSPTPAQSDMVRFLYPLLAGFATSFISGGLFLMIDFPRAAGGRLALSASAGLAIFIFVYLRPPYWYPGVPSKHDPAAMLTPTPVPEVAPVDRPRGAQPVASPFSTPALVGASPVATLPQPASSALPGIAELAPTPLPLISQSQRAGRVLLLIEDEIVSQAMVQKMVDYSLRPVLIREYGEVESGRVRESLSQAQVGNAAAGASIPFAAVITGRVDSSPMGDVQGAYLVEATVTVVATILPGGETLRQRVTRRGGGQARESATRSALREVAANIPEIFYRQLEARAR